MDNMIIKSKERDGHDQALQKFFTRLRKYHMCLNPKKCTFGVTSGKLLRYIISLQGIEVDLLKIKAMQEILPPKIKKEIQEFLGRL